MEKQLDEISNSKELIKNDQLEKVEALLKENLEINQELRVMVRHINTYVAWQKVFGWLKLLLILISFIVGFIYLPPLFKDLYQQVISLVSGRICQ